MAANRRLTALIGWVSRMVGRRHCFLEAGAHAGAALHQKVQGQR